MRLAAFAAGASLLGVATTSRKSLEMVRNVGLGLVAVFGLAAFAAARFEKAMSEVRAVTGGSAGDMKKLSQAALDAGQSTMYSATQAAKAEAELARAGISTADIIGGALKGSLDLAASGQLELAEAAIISAQAMNAFKMEGGDVGHIADVISAGAGKSATNVHDMGMAFRQAALMSSQTGLSLEDTVGSLSLFAQNALTGSDAGTSLKVMLQRLVPQSKEAAGTMEDIGFSAYDAQGNFIGLSALAGVMQQSFAKLTPEARNAAMATIFGSDAVRAATILYEAGTPGINKWVSAVDDTGYATRVAATMTDNLSGDLERLKGALETALISSGTTANAVLRNMAQVLTDVVNWYGRLSPSMQSSVTVMAGLLGMVGFVGAGLLLMLPRIMAVRAELTALGLTAARTRAAMMMVGRLGLVVAGVAAMTWGIGKLAEQFEKAPPNVTKLANAMVDFAQKGKMGGEIAKTFGKDLDGFGEAVARIAHPGALDRVEDFFSTFDPNADGGPSLEAATTKLKALDEALTSLVTSGATEEAAVNFAAYAKEAEKGGTSTEKFKTLLPGYTEALAAADTQNKLTAGGQAKLGDETAMTADDMKDQRTEAEKLTDALKTLNGVNIGAAEAEIGFRSSLHDLTTAVKENGHSLDVTTEKGRTVKGAYLDAAQAAMDHAQAVAEQKDSVEAGNAVLEKDIAVLKRVMHQAGFTDTQIDQLISSYAQLPGAKQTKVTAPGATKAIRDIDALYAEVRDLQPGKTITIKAPTGAAIKALEAAGYSVKRIPGSKNVKITAPTGTAQANARALKREIDRLRSKTITLTTKRHYINITENRTINTGKGGRGPNAGGATGGQWTGRRFRNRYSTGGLVEGPGSPTSDSVSAPWLSRDEFVIRAAAVRHYGAGMFEKLNAMRMPAGGYAGSRVSGQHYAASGGSTGQTVALQRVAAAELTAALGDLSVNVFVGNEPIRGIARAEVRRSNGELVQVLDAGGGM